MSKPLSYEYVKNYIESQNYKLISKEYKSNKIKLDIKCDKGHLYSTRFDLFLNGNRCPECRSINLKGKKRKRYTEEEVKNILNKEGYELLKCSETYRTINGTDYIPLKSNIKVLCDKKHEISILLDGFNRGRRCGVCDGNAKLNPEEVKKYVESRGHKLLSKKFNSRKIKIQSCNKHIIETSYAHYKEWKVNCPKCSMVGTGHNKKYKTIEEKRLANLARIKNKRKTDIHFRISEAIKRGFRQAMLNYSKTGKIWKMKKYGINTEVIIEKLGNPPQDGKVYHIDHILPINAFDHNDLRMIKLCWHPNNLQWLEASENVKKFNKHNKKEFEEYIRTDAD